MKESWLLTKNELEPRRVNSVTGDDDRHSHTGANCAVLPYLGATATVPQFGFGVKIPIT